MTSSNIGLLKVKVTEGQSRDLLGNHFLLSSDELTRFNPISPVESRGVPVSFLYYYINFLLPSELLMKRKDKFIAKFMASQCLLDYFALSFSN